MTLRLNYTVASDRGLVRGNNEDSAYAGPNLLALADGMGGHAAGEVASSVMISHLEVLDADPGDNDMLALLGGVADDANHAIANEVGEHPDHQGMGTTLTALLFNGSELAMCHVGDSRGYRLRDGELEQITVDDTYVQSLVQEGKLAPEDVSTHPQRSLILKAYTGAPVDPTLTSLEAREGDRWLLCSDGLSDPVSTETIRDALAEGSPEHAAQRLIELALRSGGPDNVTVVIADIVSDDSIDDAARATLPVTPAVAGALLGEEDYQTHPETPAGRAAALNRPAGAGAASGARRDADGRGESSRRVVAGAGAAGAGAAGAAGAAAGDRGAEARTGAGARRDAHGDAPEGEDNEDTDSDADRDDSRRGVRWGALITALVVAIVLIAGGWWAVDKARGTYFITADDTGRLLVERGLDYSVFGRDLHNPHQAACLAEDGTVTLVAADADAGGSDCRPFALQDLPESTRSQVDALPSGSYDEVNGQLRRLGDEALPVCVTRPAGEKAADAGKDAKDARDGADKAVADKDAQNSGTADGGDKHADSGEKAGEDGALGRPGVDCREAGR